MTDGFEQGLLNIFDLFGFAFLVYLKTPFNPPCSPRPIESLFRCVMLLGNLDLLHIPGSLSNLATRLGHQLTRYLPCLLI